MRGTHEVGGNSPGIRRAHLAAQLAVDGLAAEQLVQFSAEPAGLVSFTFRIAMETSRWERGIALPVSLPSSCGRASKQLLQHRSR